MSTFKYDTERLKKIDIVSWLERQGYKRTRGSGKYVSFYSPFGRESNPSLKVNTAKNSFVDYHSGIKGDVLTLVKEINNCSFPEACAILSNDINIDIKPYEPQKKAEGVKIHSVSELTDEELIDYILGVRRLSKAVVDVYCKQIVFSFPYSKKDPKKQYIGIGFQTGKNSWEIRNTFMKIAAGAKSIKTIRGTDEEKGKEILFEAWLDYLSYLTINKIVYPKLKTHILNGAGLINVLKPIFKGKTIYVYVDQDRAGDKIIETLDNCTIIDKRGEFGFASDYNEYLMGL